jgi:hypothetical protein
MVRIGWLSLAPLTILIAYGWSCGPIGPTKGGPGEQAKGSSLADLRADQKELAELDGQIEANEKMLAILRKKADALRAKVGLGQTWVEIDGKTYGAKPDKRGPIGGSAGYNDIVTKGCHLVATLDQLLDALKKAKKGDVILIDGGAEIDCTERVAVEKLVIEIPSGVTLASNRGQGDSQGALILSDWFATAPLIRPMGPASADVSQVSRSLYELVAAGKQSITYLNERLRPASPATADEAKVCRTKFSSQFFPN